ncbi:chaperone SurA [bacterium BMS3Bbin06]|nr:chaperone SurA [bacterium BMS3Abin08]GBE34100.1 chaperone SurA [bacterium BMS3Bbin06]HDO36127.1 hypothetical protein [Nitrospirota bacterium]HDY72396.1 hypothetical protein [Nitrospirota bacterium]
MNEFSTRDNQLPGKGVFLLSALICILLAGVGFFRPPDISAEIVDRVVAFINNEAITQSEFRDYLRDVKKVTPDITETEAIETLINKKLILMQARKLRIKGASDDEVIRKYISIKIRAFVKVTEDDTRTFYEQNLKRFRGVSFQQIKDEIERLLIERRVNRALKKYIEELRRKAYIRVNLRGL